MEYEVINKTKNKDFTQIQISKKTRQLLKKIRLVERESYEGVILRLIKIAEQQDTNIYTKLKEDIFKND